MNNNSYSLVLKAPSAYSNFLQPDLIWHYRAVPLIFASFQIFQISVDPIPLNMNHDIWQYLQVLLATGNGLRDRAGTEKTVFPVQGPRLTISGHSRL